TNTTYQVNKSRLSRWITNDELFAIQNREKIHNKHVLLVDDMITTGATMEACISVLTKAKKVKISNASRAIAEGLFSVWELNCFFVSNLKTKNESRLLQTSIRYFSLLITCQLCQ